MTRVRTRLSAGWLACLATGLILVGVGPVQAQRATLKNDKAVLAAFRGVVAKPSQSTVRILCDDKETALGTIVSGDGYLVTKASELKGKIVCKLRDGKTYPARIVGIEDKSDLAMLKIDARGLKPIEWADPKSAVVGNWLASPGIGEDPVAIGVVSVAARQPSLGDMPGPTPAPNSGFLGILLEDADGIGAKIRQVESNTPAFKAGLKAGDIVVAVQGRRVPDSARLINAIMGFKAGDVVKLKVKRGDTEKDIVATLGKRPSSARSRGDIQNSMGSALSRIRGGFPAILQHDTVIKNTDCGGPVVGLDGKAVGINIARAGRTESYAIPSDKVRALLADLRSGKLAPKDEPVVNVEDMQDSIKKLKAQMAAARKAREEADDDGNEARVKALGAEIKALKQRLDEAEAALKKAQGEKPNK